ncbi:uncharacterized protein VP01_104g11 [Puccinia sorghi]|uniref:Ribosomal protein/NADH dehydrogenase domain-containing protein n=1 Tax=Puccinia sorghi TaxID=27349 RepID=A0A0L6VU76_9BASI|nr:uncharacterized protein VP01_104g11 [Puccinia sorghi]
MAPLPEAVLRNFVQTGTMASTILKQALPSTVREIRLHFSPTHASQIKSFIQSSYSSLKSSNPDLPVMFRESSVGTPARAIVRFDSYDCEFINLSFFPTHQSILQFRSSTGFPLFPSISEYGVEKQVSLEQAKSSSDIESLLSSLIQGKN